MQFRAPILFVVCLLVSAGLLAQAALPVHVIPVISKTKGDAGTDWRSDLTITNYTAKGGTLGAHYFPAGAGNGFNGTFLKTFAISAKQTLLVQDVIGSWFPQYGASTFGFLLIADLTPRNCADETQGPLSLVVTSRTYNNANPAKTYGQSVPSNWTAFNYTTAPTIITGIRHEPGQSPGYRTNVGVANLSNIPILVHITAHRADNSVAGTSNQTIPPLTLFQSSLTNLGVASLPSTGGYVEVTLDPTSIKVDPCAQADDAPACMSQCSTGCNGKYGFSSSGTFIAYASKVDNGSGDAEFLSGVVDWANYNDGCSATKGFSPAMKMLDRIVGQSFKKPATFRKLPK